MLIKSTTTTKQGEKGKKEKKRKNFKRIYRISQNIRIINAFLKSKKKIKIKINPTDPIYRRDLVLSYLFLSA